MSESVCVLILSTTSGEFVRKVRGVCVDMGAGDDLSSLLLGPTITLVFE